MFAYFDMVYKKYKNIIPYLFFGGCTTFINVLTYYICAHFLCIHSMISTIIAWIIAVLFAYITNRRWVFYSYAKGYKDIGREMASFFGCRIATGVVDCLCMYLFVHVLNYDDVIIKFIANVIVIVLNYLASKLIVFNNSKRRLI